MLEEGRHLHHRHWRDHQYVPIIRCSLICVPAESVPTVRAGTWELSPGYLIRARLLCVIDDQGFDLAFVRDEFQTELFLECDEDAW